MKRLLWALLSMVGALTWWTIRGPRTHEEVVNTIPAKVWAGGGGTISVSVDTTVAGKMSIDFEEHKKDGRMLTVIESVGPGSHSWSVEVPTNAGGYIEFDAEAPKPGDKMSWTLAHDGRQIASDAQTLAKPLGANEGFGLQEYYEDYSRPRVSDSRLSDDDASAD